MDDLARTLDEIHSTDRQRQHQAFQELMAATETPVDWAYDVWDTLVTDLDHANNRVRAIAGQLLCNLAKSDPRERVLTDFPRLLDATRDARFVTARHTLQSLWKVGTAGPAQRAAYRDGMVRRFTECDTEKNRTLIRHDILQSMRTVHDHTGDEDIRTTAHELIDTETDEKYRAKYVKLWKN